MENKYKDPYWNKYSAAWFQLPQFSSASFWKKELTALFESEWIIDPALGLNNDWLINQCLDIIMKRSVLDKDDIDQILKYAGSRRRFQAFLKIIPKLKGENYWFALKESYTNTDDLYKCRRHIKKAFMRKEPGKTKLMNKEELLYLKKLSKRIVVYRAMTERELKNKNFGVSWTTDRGVAEFFYNKYIRNFSTNHLPKCIHSIEIDKKDITAVFLERQESEIIYIADF